MRTLDTTQAGILGSGATTPTYLIDVFWAGANAYWSSNGDVSANGADYQGGIASVRSADNWRSASISLSPDEVNTALVMAGDWRGDDCAIWLFPTEPRDPIYADGYVLDGYGYNAGKSGNPILLLDGVLSAAEYSGSGPITLTVRNQASIGRWSPRTKLLPPVCNFLPAPGTKFTWAGEVYILESR